MQGINYDPFKDIHRAIPEAQGPGGVQECWAAFINAWRSKRLVSSWLDGSGASPGIPAEEFGAAEEFDGPASAVNLPARLTR